MKTPSLGFSSSSILATLAVFLVGQASSFQTIPGRRITRNRSHLRTASDLSKPSLFVNDVDYRFFESSLHSIEPRRNFIVDMLSKTTLVVGISSQLSLAPPALAEAGTDLVFTGSITVTPIAHTFVTAGKSPSPKPIRENDATRFFTNAMVVYLFDGDKNGNSADLAQEVTSLTKIRKAERGPGVTPGNVQTLTVEQMKKTDDPSAIVSRVVETAKQMTDGDVLLVGPIRSLGTQGDGKILDSTASGLGTFVGGKREKGVISVLLNGQKENLKMVEAGFPISELLWYGLPKKE